MSKVNEVQMSPRQEAIDTLIERLHTGNSIKSSETIGGYPVAKLILEVKRRGLIIDSQTKKLLKARQAIDWRLHLVGRYVEYKLKVAKK